MSGAAAFSGNRFEYLLESLNRVGEYVAKAGDPYLTVSFETCSTTELHRQYLGSTPLALWFVDKLAKEQYPCFRITFDLAHLVEIGEDPAASLEIAGDRALHLHLSSCVLAPGDPRSGDLHLPLDTPGAHPTMAETSRALQRWKARIVTAGPQEVPVISTEVRSQPGQDSAETHRHCRRMMARFSKQVGMHRVGAPGGSEDSLA
jgi:sugar phosphate isomerase/epimerase